MDKILDFGFELNIILTILLIQGKTNTKENLNQRVFHDEYPQGVPKKNSQKPASVDSKLLGTLC